VVVRHTILARASALIAVVVGLGLVLTSDPVAGAGPRHMGGYTLRAFEYGHSQVRVVSFVGGHGYVLRTIHARPAFTGGGYASLFLPHHGAIAGTNGSFKMHGFASASRYLTVTGGELWTTGGTQRGWLFTSNASGTQAWIGRPTWSINVTAPTTSFDVASWNHGQPTNGDAVAFTSRGGEIYPTTQTCTALLESVSGDLADHVYTVAAVRVDEGCTRRPLQPTTSAQDVVLAGDPVAGLHAGDTVHISVDLGHAGITEAFGGWPQEVTHGTNTGPGCIYCGGHPSGSDDPIFDHNPRTTVGISEGCEDADPETACRFFLVTVDGRAPGWSRGLRFPALAELMLSLGAYEAVNLDGGGSTLMWTRRRPSGLCEANEGPLQVGCIVNRPCYTERLVIDGVGVVPAPSMQPSP
jgi:hypothetical protein